MATAGGEQNEFYPKNPLLATRLRQREHPDMKHRDLSESPDQAKRRILCIDGGGIRGAFPVAFLSGLEQHLAHPIGSYFDLIVGTSTGGILAAGLALGLPASNLLALYETRSSEIFGKRDGSPINWSMNLFRCIRHLLYSKHNPDNLRSVLLEVFGDKRIGDAKTRLMIPAWDSNAKSPHLYKTAHHQRLKVDYLVPVIDAVLATAAAPTYFPQHTAETGAELLDGGVWGNNPIAIATVEAVTLLGWPPKSLRILSLGCLEEVYSIPKHSGIGNLGSKALKLLMDGQSKGAMGAAMLLTGHPHEQNSIYRVDHAVPNNSYKLDDVRSIRELKGLGHHKARIEHSALNPVFFDAPAEEFVPHHQL